jgi:hypothetical protein
MSGEGANIIKSFSFENFLPRKRRKSDKKGRPQI